MVVNHQHYRSLVCVSSSYRFIVNSSCTHTHIYIQSKIGFFSLSPSLGCLSFFLYSSSTSTTIVIENVFFQLCHYVHHHLFLNYRIQTSRYDSLFIRTWQGHLFWVHVYALLMPFSSSSFFFYRHSFDSMYCFSFVFRTPETNEQIEKIKNSAQLPF